MTSLEGVLTFLADWDLYFARSGGTFHHMVSISLYFLHRQLSLQWRPYGNCWGFLQWSSKHTNFSFRSFFFLLFFVCLFWFVFFFQDGIFHNKTHKISINLISWRTWIFPEVLPSYQFFQILANYFELNTKTHISERSYWVMFVFPVFYSICFIFSVFEESVAFVTSMRKLL